MPNGRFIILLTVLLHLFIYCFVFLFVPASTTIY